MGFLLYYQHSHGYQSDMDFTQKLQWEISTPEDQLSYQQRLWPINNRWEIIGENINRSSSQPMEFYLVMRIVNDQYLNTELAIAFWFCRKGF